MEKFDAQGIFLLFEGLPRTVIESQVLSVAKKLGQAGLQVEVWAFAINNQSYKEGLAVLPKYSNDFGLKIRLFKGVRSIVPFSRIINAALLFMIMRISNASPAFVRGRTEYATAVASLVKPFFGFKLVWDARGDTVNEYKGTMTALPTYIKWLAGLKLRAIKERLKVVAKQCDRAIFVSEALMSLQGQEVREKDKVVIPCAADEKLFFCDAELRMNMRRKLGYKKCDVVMVYAGSIAPWQCIEETIGLMSKTIKMDINYKALVITPDIQSVLRLISPSLKKSFYVVSCSLVEMNGYLNAADIGFLLREENAINRVASPVKYSEYSMAGLLVVSSKAVLQVQDFGKKIDNVLEPTVDCILNQQKKSALKSRLTRAKKAHKLYGMRMLNENLKQIHGF